MAICFWVGASSASAQDLATARSGVDSVSVGDERALFAAAMAAIADQRFATARDRLREALAISRRAASAFNLAIALRGTGELTAAVEILELLRIDHFGELSAAETTAVEALRRELTPELSTLRVHIRGASDPHLRIDGVPRRLNEAIRLDPGLHLVLVGADGFMLQRRSVEMARGTSRSLDFSLSPRPASSSRSLLWVWALVGTLVLGAAAIATVAIVTRDPDPVTDPVFGNTMTLGVLR